MLLLPVGEVYDESRPTVCYPDSLTIFTHFTSGKTASATSVHGGTLPPCPQYAFISSPFDTGQIKLPATA
jgi:hypothetical protein